MSETRINPQFMDPLIGAQHLQRMPVFEGFSSEERQRIYSLGELRTYQAGANVIIEGELSVGFYIVLEGQVAVYKAARSGDASHRLATFGVEKAFGELSLIDHKPRSATIAAETDSVLFHLDGVVWERVLEQDLTTAVRFYKNFAGLMASRLRDLDEEYIYSQRLLWKFALTRPDSEGDTTHARTP
jgi:CRP/FNR family transcriptional regulator, cyclic AMP receptor protein